TERGAVAMYKIRPPIGEHRWIPGQAAVPADGKFRQLPGSPASDLVAEQAGRPEKSAAESAEVDPFAQAATPGGRLFDDPAGGTAPAKSTGEELVNRPTVRISADGSYRRVAPPVDELNESR